MAGALVLLHGFTQTGASWDGVRAALPPERYRQVLAPDLRGHGTAADARPVTFDAVLGDIAELAPDRFTLCGYSMGGRLALLFALAHPDRVERLVLIGASPGIANAEERARRRAADAQLADAIERHGIAAFAARWAELTLWAGQPPEVAAAANAMRLAQDPAGLATALRGLGTAVMAPVWDRLGELDLPVVCAAGERDERYTAMAERMADRLPSAEVMMVPGAGHAAQLEAPAAVAALLAPPPRRVLLTGMSGVGKSTLVAELRRRGVAAYDADDDGFSEARADGRWGWRADAVADLLSAAPEEGLVFAGCSEEQATLPFDYRVLLTAPRDELIHRLRTRTTNTHGRTEAELAQVLADLDEVEPLLRRTADLVLDATRPSAELADELLGRMDG